MIKTSATKKTGTPQKFEKKIKICEKSPIKYLYVYNNFSFNIFLRYTINSISYEICIYNNLINLYNFIFLTELIYILLQKLRKQLPLRIVSYIF